MTKNIPLNLAEFAGLSAFERASTDASQRFQMALAGVIDDAGVTMPPGTQYGYELRPGAQPLLVLEIPDPPEPPPPASVPRTGDDPSPALAATAEAGK